MDRTFWVNPSGSASGSGLDIRSVGLSGLRTTGCGLGSFQNQEEGSYLVLARTPWAGLFALKKQFAGFHGHQNPLESLSKRTLQPPPLEYLIQEVWERA